MSKPVFKIRAVVEFTLHSDFEDGTEGTVVDGIIDSLQDERIGVAEYKSIVVESINIEPVES